MRSYPKARSAALANLPFGIHPDARIGSDADAASTRKIPVDTGIRASDSSFRVEGKFGCRNLPTIHQTTASTRARTFDADVPCRHAKSLSTPESAHRIPLSESRIHSGVANLPRLTEMRSYPKARSTALANVPFENHSYAPMGSNAHVPATRKIPVDTGIRNGFLDLCRGHIWVSKQAQDSPRCARSRCLVFRQSLEFHGPRPLLTAGGRRRKSAAPRNRRTAVLRKGAHRDATG